MNFLESTNAKWRKELFRACVIFAIIGFVAEVVIYLYISCFSELILSASHYRIRFIYIPVVLNLFVIGITACFLSSKNFSDQAKDKGVCILVYFLCANMQVSHYIYSPLLMLPAIAIFVTIIVADRKLTLYIFCASLISLFLAYCQAALELRKDDPQLIIDVIIAAMGLYVSFVVAKLLTQYVKKQMKYILNSNEKQKLLLEECNLDPLMEIGNRRALNERLDHVVHNATMAQNAYILLMDIDDFKQVNDIYGHQCGDEVLIVLAGLIRAMAPYERIEGYRYGGEEIVLLLLNKDESHAFHCCENILNTFSNLRYSFEPKHKITFSGGLVAYRKGMTAEDWIKEADEALYFAKGNGKNQIQREASVRVGKE